MAQRLLTPAFVALTLAELAYFIAVGIMIPVVPLFAAGSLNAGPVGVGVAVGAFSLTALALRPIAGRMSDRLGSGRLFLYGGILFTIVAAAHLVVADYRALLVLRVLLGIAEAMFFVAGMAALADIAPPDRLGEALSYNSLGLYLGIAIGPALGEWLLDVGSFRAAWIGAACLGLAASVLAVKVPSPQRIADTASVPLLPGQLVAPGLAFLAGLSGAAGFLGFAALHAREVGLSGAGPVLFVYGIVVIGCRLLFAKLSDRYQPARLSAVALALCGAGLVVMSAWRMPAGLIAGATVLAVGITFLTPAFFRIMMSRLPAGHRGAAAATFSIFVDLGLGGGPVVVGLIARWSSIATAFAVMAGLALIAATLTLANARRSR